VAISKCYWLQVGMPEQVHVEVSDRDIHDMQSCYAFICLKYCR
jgi:hypothetical protein